MNHKFKKHQKIKILYSPIIYNIEPCKDPPVDIKAGMIGEVNLILPNGDYHIRIFNNKGETIAYVAMDEDSLEFTE